MSIWSASLPAVQRPNRLPFRVWMSVLGVLMVVGVISGVIVLINGLQVTGLSDQVPWGLWIALDLSAISLGAGAFIFSAIVYLMGIERFRIFARICVLGGFVGYSSAMFALALDIGRPDRFWYPVIYPNIHSVLWEITMCVIFYFTVLMAEMAPVVLASRLFARFPGAKSLGATIHKATPFLAVIGLLLSLLHQSSLGATYGIIAARPLWYKPSLPIMFILSAAGGGIAASILLALIVSEIRGKWMIKPHILHQAAIIGGSATALYLYIKIWDWASTTYYSKTAAVEEGLNFLVTTPYTQTFWWVEVVLGALIPVVIFLWPALRKNNVILMAGCVASIVGVVALRWNVTISGLIVPLDWSPGSAFLFPRNAYTPTLLEAGAFLGIIAYALMAVTLAVRYLPIFEEEHHPGQPQPWKPQ